MYIFGDRERWEDFQERRDSGDADGKASRVIPDVQVVTVLAAEVLVLDEEDEREGDRPVSEHGYEVVDDSRERILARNGKDGDHKGIEERPYEARHGMENMAKKLQRKTVGVVDGDLRAG